MIPPLDDAPPPNLSPAFTPQRLEALMQGALFQAYRTLGQTAPNPAVGAVIADAATSEILASAATALGGRPHAEPQAIAMAGSRARGAVLFVTLEPCSHYGATPPCADAIIEAGISTVFCGVFDPDPRVGGRGIARLKSQGIGVAKAPLAAEAHWLHLGHILRVTEHRPFVQIKLAVDANGRVPTGDGNPIWVSCESALAQAHLLRARADAIMVGRGTLMADNPKLTCRLPGLQAASPIRIIISSACTLPQDRDLYSSTEPPVWLVCGGADAETLAQHNESIIPVPLQVNGRPDLGLALQALAKRGITRLLVEGGPTLVRAFLDADLVDEAIIAQSPSVLEKDRSLPGFSPSGVEFLTEYPHFAKIETRYAGCDAFSVYRAQKYWQG